ncbi:hypothetical protein GLOIN_2v1487315 [Rhizophagus irregularis DAOM 181602=DAOM 197198]|uniref:Uncharacterized protein n=1 Tax=Rhizophagus irregularis (strain DAOM 181602 / DAOM 197198 / MUCL 43194) TaxID=747089 RepID=A0A2P4P3Z1_RHIID|nr:hypothetical protein GLOIN_2v1487315 [Rhizophagus irregularis DAOM 181602=DAOM 197198]POG60094.1 hypothetical protein GLOIN_2v1487315 [Rhizophagus irregularis DAOM 181602=DAOM 197198]|eukprot:XP_025166960.1 hypothetical protein GLOIN_2v1487315 [Rhizophagus irregularis DAOM 181602=DAOM 197198]
MGTMVQIGYSKVQDQVQVGLAEALDTIEYDPVFKNKEKFEEALTKSRVNEIRENNLSINLKLTQQFEINLFYKDAGIWICPMITGFRKWRRKQLLEHIDLVNQSSKSNKDKVAICSVQTRIANGLTGSIC